MVVEIELYEARAKLSELAERARAGEQVILSRNGEPYVELRPYTSPQRPRTPGRLAGGIHMAADFDETPGAILEAFEGRS